MDRPYVTAMSYSYLRHISVVEWCSKKFAYTTWSCDVVEPVGITLRCIVVRFERAAYKTLFDLTWSNEFELWASPRDYFINVNPRYQHHPIRVLGETNAE